MPILAMTITGCTILYYLRRNMFNYCVRFYRTIVDHGENAADLWHLAMR